MVKKSFKDIVKEDVDKTFIREDEFADTHIVNGKEMLVVVDDFEIIERARKGQFTMDGVHVRQKLIYVKANEFGALPAIRQAIMFDGKRYLVTDATDEQGVYAITMEANTSKVQ